MLKTNIIDSFIEFFETKAEKIVEQLPSFVLAIVMIFIGVWIAKPFSRWIARLIVGRNQDQLIRGFVETTTRLIITLVFIIWGLQFAGYGNVANTLLTSAGIGTLIIGLAFQDLAQNFIGGIVLIFNRPFDEDDTITVNNVTGQVESIKLRYTVVKTEDGQNVYIPNGDLIKNPLFNYSKDGRYQWKFSVSIEYNNNLQRAEQLIHDTITNLEPVVYDNRHINYTVVETLDETTAHLKTYFWIKIGDSIRKPRLARAKVVNSVKDALVREGYKIVQPIQ